MAKKLFEKTAGIDMSGFAARKKVPPASGHPLSGELVDSAAAEAPARKTFTGVGMVMAAITGNQDGLATTKAELETANQKLAEFDGATLVRALEPTTVRRSQWANRNEAEFSTSEFLELKEEIGNAGGNVQPIKVRTVKGVFNGKTPLHEIVFGHRRHQACLELGLAVNAVVVDDMNDQALFEAMDRENRGRKNLSAWEQGRMYDEAIKKGLYTSIRRLVEALGVNLSNAARAVQLAKLPREVVDAFASPLDLQVRWSKALTDKLQSDPEAVLARARDVAKNRGSMGPTEVFERLIGKGAKPSTTEIEILTGGKKVATFRTGPKGRAVVEFESALSAKKQSELIKLIEKFSANG